MKSIFTLFAFLLLGGLSAQALDSGLVIHYPLDGNLTDTISGETAENNGNLTFEAGRVGGAVRYFNQDAYFVTPSEKLQVGPEADGGTAGTFALFVNHRGAPLETDRQNYIAQKNGCGPDPDNPNRGRVVLYRQDPTNATDPDSLISFITGRPLRTNYKLDSAETWIHLALTVDPEIREWGLLRRRGGDRPGYLHRYYPGGKLVRRIRHRSPPDLRQRGPDLRRPDGRPAFLQTAY